jgi:hypothetical protein
MDEGHGFSRAECDARYAALAAEVRFSSHAGLTQNFLKTYLRGFYETAGVVN